MTKTQRTASQPELDLHLPKSEGSKAVAVTREVVPRGSDNFDSSDVVLPKVKLLQGLSPEIESFDGAQIGLFWHSGMDMPLTNSFRFIVCDRRKKYLLSAPIQDGQGVLARADDARTWNTLGEWQVKIKGVKGPVTWAIRDLDVRKSGLAEWGTYIPGDEDSPPAATLFYDYLVLLPDHLHLGPAIISLARTSIRSAKKGLNDKIALQFQNGRPMQRLVFTAESFDDTADGQSFKNWRFKSSGFVEDDGLFETAKSYIGALMLSGTRIDDEAEGSDIPSSGPKESDKF